MPATERALVTAALPYVNNVPHVGHIVGSHLPADILARYLRAKGADVLFVGGSDESGTTSELAAREHGLPVADFCARLHAVHKRIYEWFGISYDIYSETTRTPIHHEMTREIFSRVAQNGYIREGTTEQLYCPKDKLFLADRYVQGTCPHCGFEGAFGDQCERCGHFLDPKILKSPRCKICGAAPEPRTSRHLFLRLDALAPRLEAWIQAQSHWRPQVRSVALGWIREGLRERMITRDLAWGVKVPFEGFCDKVFYVWFDAPIGYISFTKQLAPERWREFWGREGGAKIYHVLGKDNIAFHTIFWPAILLADGTFALPFRVDGEQFLNYEGQKISKSRRWGVFCERLPEAGIDPDVLRAYLTVLIPETADTEFRWDDFERRVNSELIGTFANFVHRGLALVRSKLGGEIVRPAEAEWQEADRALVLSLGRRAAEVDRLLGAGEVRAAWAEILALAADGNRYFDQMAPWKLAKEDKARAARVLWLCATVSKALAVLAAPFIPKAAARAWAQLALPGRPDEPGAFGRAAELSIPARHMVGEPKPLFQKLTPEELARVRAIVTEPTDLGELLAKENGPPTSSA
jgi:methionyl-tRNA synthetase